MYGDSPKIKTWRESELRQKNAKNGRTICCCQKTIAQAMQKTLQKLTELLKGVAILCKYMKTICLSKSWRTSQRCGIFVLYFWILFKNYIIKLLQIIKTIRMNFSIGNVKISWAFKLLIYISQYFQYTVICLHFCQFKFLKIK